MIFDNIACNPKVKHLVSLLVALCVIGIPTLHPTHYSTDTNEDLFCPKYLSPRFPTEWNMHIFAHVFHSIQAVQAVLICIHTPS